VGRRGSGPRLGGGAQHDELRVGEFDGHGRILRVSDRGPANPGPSPTRAPDRRDSRGEDSSAWRFARWNPSSSNGKPVLSSLSRCEVSDFARAAVLAHAFVGFGVATGATHPVGIPRRRLRRFRHAYACLFWVLISGDYRELERARRLALLYLGTWTPCLSVFVSVPRVGVCSRPEAALRHRSAKGSLDHLVGAQRPPLNCMWFRWWEPAATTI
jgi:hypothetical protein